MKMRVRTRKNQLSLDADEALALPPYSNKQEKDDQVNFDNNVYSKEQPTRKLSKKKSLKSNKDGQTSSTNKMLKALNISQNGNNKIVINLMAYNSNIADELLVKKVYGRDERIQRQKKSGRFTTLRDKSNSKSRTARLEQKLEENLPK